jgi:hypothetical protein
MAKPKSKKDYLHITLKGDITTAVDKYCEAMRINPKDIGFHMGHIAGSNDELEKPLGILMQVHFFAGIFHAMEKKKEVSLKYLNKKEWEKVKDNMNRKQLTETQPTPLNDDLSYLG